jgi:hypothetical protein
MEIVSRIAVWNRFAAGVAESSGSLRELKGAGGKEPWVILFFWWNLVFLPRQNAGLEFWWHLLKPLAQVHANPPDMVPLSHPSDAAI